MQIRKRKVKDSPNFCFNCGKTLEDEEYVLNLGTPGSTFEFCKSCMKEIGKRATKVTEKKSI